MHGDQQENECIYVQAGVHGQLSQVCTWLEMLCGSLGPCRCQDATSRISIKFNVREGQSGELQVRVETGDREREGAGEGSVGRYGGPVWGAE